MSLTLTRYKADGLGGVADQHTFPLKVVVSGTDGDLGNKIFVYHADMNDDPAVKGDRFEAIASVNQMLELPEDNPVGNEAGKTVPFYRKNEVLVMCHSEAEMEELWTIIQEDAADLVANFASHTNLSATEAVTL